MQSKTDDPPPEVVCIGYCISQLQITSGTMRPEQYEHTNIIKRSNKIIQRSFKVNAKVMQRSYKDNSKVTQI